MFPQINVHTECIESNKFKCYLQCKRHYLKSQRLSKIVLFTEQMQYLPLRAIGSIYRKAKTKQVSFLDADSSCQIDLEYYVKFLVKSLVKCEHTCISYGNKVLEDISKIFDFIKDRKVRTLNKTSEANQYLTLSDFKASCLLEYYSS